MTEPRQLLAKSPRGGTALTLEQHGRDAESAARTVFVVGSRALANWLRFFRLQPADEGEFLKLIRLAVLAHDLGKANEEFQAAVQGRLRRQQFLRHEHLSAILLHLPEVRSWLEHAGVDAEIVTAAVLSHHAKAAPNGKDTFGWGDARPDANPAILCGHPEVQHLFHRMAQVCNTPPPTVLQDGSWDERRWQQALIRGLAVATTFKRRLRRDRERRRMLLAVKGALYVADAVSSGLVREGHDITSWVNHARHRRHLEANEVREAIIARRGAQIARTKGRAFSLSDFQQGVVTVGRRGLLLAGCGTGKTLAAWNWASAVLAKERLGHVVFLYPTRGTATEGFRDYVGWAPETEAQLLTGTARYELDAMMSNPSEALQNKDFSYDAARARLFALGLWDRRYFSATVDQFLGFLEHRYSSLCLLPVLSDAAIIIDEVHSFSTRMFERLLSFLEHFDAPVLCMTATLPPDRRRALEEAGLRLYPSPEDRDALAKLEGLESAPRYDIRRSTVCAARKLVASAWAEGRRVLWVVNTVGRCQCVAKELSADLGVEVPVYHSRFTLRDRQRVHQRTVEAFQQTVGAAIAVTTQVCEMSLDLDADVLITETAPVSSLVQRFGRSNRHLARGPDFRAKILVVPPEQHQPYSKEDMERADDFLNDVEGPDVSQRQLANAIERHSAGGAQPEAWAGFVSGGYYAVQKHFRDSDDWSVPCVLDDELSEVRAARSARKPIDGYVLQVPWRAVEQESATPSWLPRHLRVASGRRYDRDADGHGRLGFLADGEVGP